MLKQYPFLMVTALLLDDDEIMIAGMQQELLDRVFSKCIFSVVVSIVVNITIRRGGLFLDNLLEKKISFFNIVSVCILYTEYIHTCAIDESIITKSISRRRYICACVSGGVCLVVINTNYLCYVLMKGLFILTGRVDCFITASSHYLNY